MSEEPTFVLTLPRFTPWMKRLSIVVVAVWLAEILLGQVAPHVADAATTWLVLRGESVVPGLQLWRVVTYPWLENPRGFGALWSFAEEAQRWVHRVIGAPDPQGWDHQLRAQLGANLFLDAQRRIALTRGERWLEADLMPRATLAVGNVFDHVEAGAQVRLGRLDSSPWGEPPIPSYRVAGEVPGRGTRERIEAYVVTAVTGRASAYDYSLQGDHAAERFGITPIPFVGTWEVGLGLGMWRAKVEFRWIVRSPDFNPVREPQGYGSLRLAVGG